MAQIVLDRVWKKYSNDIAAVRDVSLTCPDGAFVVLVGPSGCGKSTTLRMVAGLEDISDGTIRIGDRIINNVPPKDRDIAMVFQNYALYPHMTVFDNMAFALKLRRIPRDQIAQRVNAVAQTLGLETLLKRKPAALSGGQRQRVAVGRAIVREPKAFLFDEPLSNLDAKLRITTRAELKALHQRLKTTTLYVTHDQEEAMTLADIVVVMSNGLIQQVGPPLHVYAHPANRFVAAFLGTPPMNFIQGAARLDHQTPFLDCHDNASIRLPDRFRSAVAANLDKPLVLGVRPQALRILPPAPPDSPAPPASPESFSARVHVVEPLGDQMDVTCFHPAGNLVARVDTDPRIKPNMTLQLRIDHSRAHLFAPGDFGENLAPRP